ncbi:CbiQ family ECF transporter T component [Methylotenera sp.]|uniref:CbiQ family ECF transporter T component n=1 Tax=Methylotenera sp. TaxID=2051956 RepID=UPI00248832D5|nr:CbiQ family ECF transporter T component [Methylotenera sp.]MDI1299970.1 CbiQ family ECF transporter T component [Methylotenera sp.]
MHPIVKILLFIFTLLLMSYLSNPHVLVLCIALFIYALWLEQGGFLRVVKRMKWLFISIFIIYAFGTPGEYVQHIPNVVAPTIEGCVLGFVQIAKLLIALAVLSILFATSSKEQLMIGLHLLLSPLNLLGINTNKFTARLLLTLDYVEELAAKEKFKFKFDQLDKMLSTTELVHKDRVIVLQSFPLKWTDILVVMVLIISTIALFYFREFNVEGLF